MFIGLNDVTRHLDSYVCGLKDLDEMLGVINSAVLKNEQASDADVYRTVGRLEQVLQYLIRPYREICTSMPQPEAPELQPLILGLFRHTLTEICDWLQCMVEDIQDPAAAFRRRGLQASASLVLTIELNLTSPPELAQLEQYARSANSSSDLDSEATSASSQTDRVPGLLDHLGALLFGLSITGRHPFH